MDINYNFNIFAFIQDPLAFVLKIPALIQNVGTFLFFDKIALFANFPKTFYIWQN